MAAVLVLLEMMTWTCHSSTAHYKVNINGKITWCFIVIYTVVPKRFTVISQPMVGLPVTLSCHVKGDLNHWMDVKGLYHLRRTAIHSVYLL